MFSLSLLFEKIKKLFSNRLLPFIATIRKDKRLLIKAGMACTVIIVLLAYGISNLGNSPASNTVLAKKNKLEIKSQGLSDPATKSRAEKIISSFENSTTNIEYDYALNIHDGRGITAGRSGFTSGTSDLLMVVRLYEGNTKNPNNALAKYVAPLEAADKTSSTKGLEGFEQAWKETSRSDPELNKAQDGIYDTLYFNPAIARAKQAGIYSAAGQLIILDTIIQHGGGNDQDGLPQIIKETKKVADRGKVEEAAWLNTFLNIRRHHLEHAANPDTAKAWKESVSRVDALRSLLKTGNLELNPPLTWKVYGDSYTLNS